MNLIAPLTRSMPFAKIVNRLREQLAGRDALIAALRDENELLKQELAFARARLLKEHRRKGEVIDFNAIRNNI